MLVEALPRGYKDQIVPTRISLIYLHLLQDILQTPNHNLLRQG
uniref:Uncharacterized protein n=1 Tax=Arundo donax TaxID=35708 RepID=A0A0A9E102_ARUDO